VRALLFLCFIGLLAGSACVGALAAKDDATGGDNAQGAYPTCFSDEDCVAVGGTCCECPTFAVHADDPIRRACQAVECPDDNQCTANVAAVCNEDQRCELACKPLACAAGVSCQAGFALDQNGCLTCDCAVPDANGCTSDSDCTRTRADCCGCQRGGFDTAVLAADRAKFDAMLMCPSQPACPGVDICTADVPTCVQGRCELASPTLPAGACGRPDLPACPAGTVCIVNASDQANMHGVGLCGTPR
jgi:hypothetical protein